MTPEISIQRRLVLLWRDPSPPGALAACVCAAIWMIILPLSPAKSLHLGMIVLTQAHFVVAAVYLFTSDRVRGRFRQVLSLLVTATALSIVYFIYRRSEAWLNLVYLYFAWHLVRDEMGLRRGAQQSRADKVLTAAFIASASFLLYIFSVGKAAVHALIHWPLDGRDIFRYYVADYRAQVFWIAAAVIWMSLGIFLLLRLRYQISLRRFYRDNQTACRAVSVLCGLAAILCILKVPSSYTVNLLILYHVAAWYWFSFRKLASKPAQGSGIRSWLRSNPGHFHSLYAAVQAVILTGFLLYFLVFHQSGWLQYYYNPSYFNAWTIFHVTLSFLKNRG